MRVLVVYDTSDNRLRRHLAKVLGGYGERVQRSAFECVVRPAERQALEARLERLVPRPAPGGADPGLPACSVRLYVLPEGTRVRELGHGRTVRDEPVLIV